MLKYPLVKSKTLYWSCQEKIVQCALKMSFKVHMKIPTVEMMQILLFKYFFNENLKTCTSYHCSSFHSVKLLFSERLIRSYNLPSDSVFCIDKNWNRVCVGILIKVLLNVHFLHCIAYYRNQCNGGRRIHCHFSLSFFHLFLESK